LFVLNLVCEAVYNMNVKRIKLNDLNMTYLWHCDLATSAGST